MKSPPIELLKRLEPLDKLSDDRLLELASFCFIEELPAQANPFRLESQQASSIYVVRGAVEVTYADGQVELVSDMVAAGRRPLAKGRTVRSARALVDAEIVRIDDDLIDIMVTWSQIAQLGAVEIHGGKLSPAEPQVVAETSRASPREWQTLSGVFSVDTLTAGVFATLPTPHIGELLKRFEAIQCKRGQVVIREGDEGDYYYVIEAGRASVTRLVGGAQMPLADLKTGDAFGEEALIAETRRNATVTMKTDGQLLRLAKSHFDALLKKPLLAEIDFEEASRRVANGAQWLDVRFPSEYQHDKIPGAINIPLGELRHAFGVLDKDVEYVAYCQSGRRSAAASFLLAQRGFRAVVLTGGLWSARPPG